MLAAVSSPIMPVVELNIALKTGAAGAMRFASGVQGMLDSKIDVLPIINRAMQAHIALRIMVSARLLPTLVTSGIKCFSK